MIFDHCNKDETVGYRFNQHIILCANCFKAEVEIGMTKEDDVEVHEHGIFPQSSTVNHSQQ